MAIKPTKRCSTSLAIKGVQMKAMTRACHAHFAVVVQRPSCVRLSVTPWTAACQASLSLIISWSLPKFLSIESVMPSNPLILWHTP